MRTSADTRKISLLLKMEREGSLIPTPEFQRRAVWTNPDKVAFIETILSGFPFPEIYIASGSVDTTTGDAIELLVDGQQRIRTIKDYFNGVSPFRQSRAIARYKDLDEDKKKEFLNYDVAVRNLGLLDDGMIREVFKRMNSTSYSLNDMERYNAIYLGEFKKFCDLFSSNEIFSDYKVFSANDIRRMKDVVYCATIVTTMLSGYFHRDDEVEEYLAQYNESFPQKAAIYARILAAVAYIRELGLPKDCRAFKKADFLTLFIEVDRQLQTEAKPVAPQAQALLVEFYAAVDEARDIGTGDELVSEYLATILQNTADRSVRIARGEVIRAVLQKADQEPFKLDAPEVDEAALNERLASLEDQVPSEE